MGVGEVNDIVDMKKMTQLNHSGIGEPPMPFYHQDGHQILE